MNDSKTFDALNARIDRLEQTVAELRALIKAQPEQDVAPAILDQMPKPSASARLEQAAVETEPESPTATVTQPEEKPTELAKNMRQSEFWLNKVGIALILFSVVFMFKYAVDQGWLTPTVRILFGLALGIALVITGKRVHATRRHFACVLMGGGIATFYISGFAAFQLFDLVSHAIAFTFMIAVTLLAFGLSLNQDESVLALIGTIGGLGTPFLLYTESGSVAGLIGYTSSVLAGSGALYFYRRWRVLLWVAFAGGILVFFIGLNGLPGGFAEAIQHRWAMQLGLIFVWLNFWGLPLLRETLSVRRSEKWGMPTLAKAEPSNRLTPEDIFVRHLHPLSLLAPLIALNMSLSTWSLSDAFWGWIILALAAAHGLTAWRLTRIDLMKDLGHTQGLLTAILISIMLVKFFDGNLLLITLTAEIVVLHWLARHLTINRLGLYAHLLFFVIAIWLIQRLFAGSAIGAAILNQRAVTDLSALAMVLTASFMFANREGRKIYRLFVHVAILGWLQREFSVLANGQGFVTITWGLYAVSLLIWGLRKDIKDLRNLALVSLLGVVAKLFLVDLSQLETLWRVLLFLGFGALFLFLSYFFQNIWKSGEAVSD